MTILDAPGEQVKIGRGEFHAQGRRLAAEIADVTDGWRRDGGAQGDGAATEHAAQESPPGYIRLVQPHSGLPKNFFSVWDSSRRRTPRIPSVGRTFFGQASIQRPIVWQPQTP